MNATVCPWISATARAQRAALRPLRGGRLIVCPVLNVESWPFEKAMPRSLLPAPHGRQHVPDVPNFSWVEYGMRVGVDRIVDAFTARDLPVGVSINAAVAVDYPAVFERLLATGWEFIAHGIRQASVSSADGERELIEQSLRMLTDASGRRPRGWMGPGLAETMQTPALLAELGLGYVLDWALDDVPVWMRTTPPLLALPYSLELNDSVIVAVERQPMPEYERRIRASAAVLSREALDGARVLALPMHPHLVGVAHRIDPFVAVLDELIKNPAVVFAAPGEIEQWYVAQSPPPEPAGSTDG